MILIPDGVILIPQRSPKIGGPCPDIWSASSTTTCRRGMRCGCGSVSVGGTREGGRGSWVLQTLREPSNPSPRATPPQSFSLLLPKVQRPGVTPRHSAFPLAGRHHHVLQQNSQSRQSVTRQNTHLKKENFLEKSYFQIATCKIAVALSPLQTQWLESSNLQQELLLGSEAGTGRWVGGGKPTSLTNLIS